MPFQSIAHEYLADFATAFRAGQASGHTTDELSFRTFLDQFLRKVAFECAGDRVSIVHEPTNQHRVGRPDWRCSDVESLGVYAYIEAKGLDPNNLLDPAPFETQISNYRSLGERLILTDGIDFLFYEPNLPAPSVISLLPKPLPLSGWQRLPTNVLLESKFREVFTEAGAWRASEARLVEEVAKRAARLAVAVTELVEAPLGSGENAAENAAIAALHELKRLLSRHHDPLLSDAEAFGGFVAQVLAFGLLYAHRAIGPAENPRTRKAKILEFVRSIGTPAQDVELRPFQALRDALEIELDQSLGPLGAWYEDCLLLLSHMELDADQRHAPDYHTLYESFLQTFDPDSRFNYGAFYTPSFLAKYIVTLCDAVARRSLGRLSIFETGNRLIDPCCGTGTFLEELVVQTHRTSGMPTINGLEILPAPYALAKYRMAMVAEELDSPLDVGVFLTNTLSDELLRVEAPALGSNVLFGAEKLAAHEAACPPLMVIVGNPPSSDSFPTHAKGAGYTIIRQLMDSFRPPAAERTGRQNTQRGLTNEFVKFLRWACYKVLPNAPAMIAFVLPSSFATLVTYRYARRWMRRHFDEFWILDLDKEGRSETDSANLFNTLQGRFLLVAIKKASETDGDTATQPKVLFTSISQRSREEKKAFLANCANDQAILNPYQPITIDDDDAGLFPSLGDVPAVYRQFWPLHPSSGIAARKAVFLRHASGVKLAPSSLLTHANASILLRRSRELGDLARDLPATLRQWFAGQSKAPRPAKLNEEVRQGLAVVAAEGATSLAPFAYRPFLTLRAILSNRVLVALQRQPNSGTRPRPEVLAAFSKEDTIGICVAPAPSDLGGELRRFASFAWATPDNDMCRRGNAHVFCNQFPAYGSGRDGEPSTNVDQEVLAHFKIALGLSNDVEASSAVVFYVYAILCSPSYLQKFKAALFHGADRARPPRVPIFADPSILSRIVSCGRSMAAEEREGCNSSNTSSNIQSNLVRSFRLTNWKQTESGLTLIDEYGNVGATVSNIPLTTVSCEIAGYTVIDEWLKVHSFRFLRKEFGLEELDACVNTLKRLTNQLRLISDLDVELRTLFEAAALISSV